MLKLAFIADLEDVNPQAECACGIMEVLQLARASWVARVQQRGNHCRLRKQLMEQPKSLSVQSRVYEGHARGIAARVVEAGHKAEANRVSARQEYNRNRRGCRFCRNRRGSIPDYDGHMALYEFSHQSWQEFVMTAGQVVFNRHILPLDIASLLETQFERRYKGRRCAGCCA